MKLHFRFFISLVIILISSIGANYAHTDQDDTFYGSNPFVQDIESNESGQAFNDCNFVINPLSSHREIDKHQVTHRVNEEENNESVSVKKCIGKSSFFNVISGLTESINTIFRQRNRLSSYTPFLHYTVATELFIRFCVFRI